MIVKKFQEVPNKKSFVCGCGKEYRYDSGFYRHKRSCTYTEGDIIDEPMEPIKKDSEKVEFCKEIFPYLKDMMLEIMPKMQSTTINTTNYKNHLMEENKDEPNKNVTEELVLYMFLGVFTIFVIDSFARAGKYTR